MNDQVANMVLNEARTIKTHQRDVAATLGRIADALEKLVHVQSTKG